MRPMSSRRSHQVTHVAHADREGLLTQPLSIETDVRHGLAAPPPLRCVRPDWQYPAGQAALDGDGVPDVVGSSLSRPRSNDRARWMRVLTFAALRLSRLPISTCERP